MRSDGSEEWITPTTGAKTLPSVEILTGRGFVTGKSGSGKSNTASVIAEELLERNFNLLIIDPEGEYYGLKERYEMLHVGADDLCDVQVGPQHAEKIAELALTKNMPVVLDVSDFLDGEKAKSLISKTVEELYRLEKDVRKPFLLMVEEMQEYMPQSGGSDDLATLLERVAKRGRKRGLGMLGMSQRPSSVDKDFITQCDWMVWHKLTWNNDLDVVRNILGKEKADQIQDFETGDGYLMTDWDDVVERVKFKKKRTHDAGATPGLESYERPDLKSVGIELLEEFNEDGSAIDLTTDGFDTTQDASVSTNGDEHDAELDDIGAIDSTEGFGVRSTPVKGSFADEDDADELEEMDEGELREAVTSLKRRNRILSDEVTELRSILEAVEPSASDNNSGAAPTPDRNRSAVPSQPTAASPPRVDPPTAPTRPPDRSGVAGNLVEFTEMLIYLCKVFVFKMRMIRRGGS